MRMLPVDTAVTVFVNATALIDDTDFKTREESVVFNQAGLDLVWNFETSAGVITQTAVTPTDTGGVYDWTNVGNGMYKIEIPASGGGTINNDTEGYGFFSGYATGILPWTGPTYAFVPAHVVNGLVAGSDTLQVDVTQFNGTAGTFAAGRPEVNTSHIAGASVSTTTAQIGVNVVQLSGDATAADNAEAFFDGTGYAGTNNVIPTVTTVTNQLTAAQIATGVWQDATAGDFTVASSIGKTLYINNVAPGGTGGLLISGSNSGTTTFGALTVTGATTLTGAVSLGSTLGITGNVTLSGAAGLAVTNGITANITGNITGNVSGSVGSVTGAVGSVTGAVGSVTGNVGGNVTGSIGSLGATAKSDVNAEVLDVLNTDTFAEPGQEAPPATTTIAKKLGYVYKAWRNKSTQTSSQYTLYADDTTTIDQKATVSDDATTFTRNEVATGP